MKIDKRTKAYKESQKSKGLGDTIAKITKATGIKAVVDKLFDDCGCDARQELLNKMFPYKKGKFLNCTEYDYVTELLPRLGSALSADDMNQVLKIYQKYVNSQQKWTSCVPCVIHMIDDIKLLHKDYEEMNKED
jgi:hypothetical protein